MIILPPLPVGQQVARKWQPAAAKETIGNAVITGFSPDKCACCWGWNVEIDGKPHRIDKFPDDVDFDVTNISFPMTVSITWSESAVAVRERSLMRAYQQALIFAVLIASGIIM